MRRLTMTRWPYLTLLLLTAGCTQYWQRGDLPQPVVHSKHPETFSDVQILQPRPTSRVAPSDLFPRLHHGYPS